MSYKKTRKSYNSLDLVKFIMALCVVAIHTQPFASTTDSIIFTLYDLIVNMAVPFFFLASGYLVGTKLSISYDVQHDTKVIGKQLLKILKMYLIWSAIYLPLAVYHYYSQGYALPFAVIQYIKWFVFVGEHYNSWHLWYLLSAIYAFALIWFFFRIGVHKKYFPIISLVAAFISIGFDIVALHSEPLPGFLHLLQKAVSLTTINGRIFRGFIYVPLGIYLTQKTISIKTCFTFFILGFTCNYFIKNNAISSVLLIVTSITLFGICLNIQLKDHAIYSVLRNLSVKVYLLHMYIWTGYYFVIYGENHIGFDSFIVTTMFSIIIGYIYLLVEKHVTCKRAKKNTLEISN